MVNEFEIPMESVPRTTLESPAENDTDFDFDIVLHLVSGAIYRGRESIDSNLRTTITSPTETGRSCSIYIVEQRHATIKDHLEGRTLQP